MKNKIYLITIVGLLLNSYVSAQDFRSGYIITHEFDTIYGMIINGGFIENATICEFKKNNSSELLKYKPFDIISYRFINGKYYISEEIKIDSIPQIVFLEYLIKGKANVFYMRNRQGDYYFLKKENDSVVHTLKSDQNYFNYDDIEDKWVYSDEVTIQKVAESKKYIGMLKYVLRDAPQLYNEYDKANLNHQSLIKVAKDYHYAVCKDESCEIYERRKKNLVGLALTGQIGTYKYNSPDIGTSNYTSMNLPSYGLNLYIQLPLLNEKLFCVPSLLIGYNEIEGTKPYRTFYTQITNYSGKIFEIPLLIKYNFISQRKFNVFFSLGPGLVFSSVKFDKSGYYFNNSYRTITDNTLPDIDGLYVGLSSMLGFDLKITKCLFLDMGANYSYIDNTAGTNRNLITGFLSLGYFLNAQMQ